MGALTLRPDEAVALADQFQSVVRRVPLRPITTSEDYDAAVRVLDSLLDAGGAEEDHPLADLAAALGRFVAEYDGPNHRPDDVAPRDVLSSIMNDCGLQASDLPEIGPEAAVLKILAGEEEMTISQARRLSKRLGLDPSVFI